MLQRIRENSQGTIAKIIVFFIVITFALFGIETVISLANSPDAPVQVNGEDISRLDIDRVLEGQKNQIRAQFGEQADAILSGNEALMRQRAIEKLINRKLFAQVARDLGHYVGDAFLAQQIQSSPDFQVAGVFNQERYLATVRRLGFEPLQYQAYAKEDININDLYMGLGQSEFLTAVERKEAARLEQQKRSFSYKTFKVVDFKSQVRVDESQIQAHYDRFPERYRTQERVAVFYVALSVAALQSGIDVSEQELQEAYELRKNLSLTQGEQRQAAHILVSTVGRSEEDYRARVVEVAKIIRDSKIDFANLAKQYSDETITSSQGGDLGFNARGVFPEAFEQALFALNEGQISGPVLSDEGTHFIKLLAIKKTDVPPFTEIKSELVNEVKLSKARVLYLEQRTLLAERAFEFDDLKALAADMKLEVEHTPLFGRSGALGVASNPAFVAAAFSEPVLEGRQISEPIEFGDDRVVMMTLKEHELPKQKPLDEVKTQIQGQLAFEAAKEVAAQQATSTLAMIEQNGVSSAWGDKQWQRVATVTRQGQKQGQEGVQVDHEVLTQIFELPKKPLPHYAVLDLASGDRVVVALEAVEEAGDHAELGEGINQLQYEVVATHLSAYQKAKRAKAKIEQRRLVDRSPDV